MIDTSTFFENSSVFDKIGNSSRLPHGKVKRSKTFLYNFVMGSIFSKRFSSRAEKDNLMNKKIQSLGWTNFCDSSPGRLPKQVRVVERATTP